jgi:Rps23 Pro-64 3,4-dihydroxylase Tpa1-like proline 4-hydroxylase
VVDVIVANLSGMTELVGKRGVDFDGISACTYLYPQGTGLSWHVDVPRLYTGAYIFYAHPTWNCQWGGELFVADESGRPQELDQGTVTLLRREGTQLRPTTVRVPAFLDNERENAELGRIGMGRYIAPKPNRLVVIASGNPHMINRVNPAAGSHVRCSVSGFFHRPGP